MKMDTLQLPALPHDDTLISNGGCMNAGKIIAYIIAGVLILFGVLFILATFGQQGQFYMFIVGLILVGIQFGIIWFASSWAKA